MPEMTRGATDGLREKDRECLAPWKSLVGKRGGGEGPVLGVVVSFPTPGASKREHKAPQQRVSE